MSKNSLKITILVDNPKSWLVTYALQIQDKLSMSHDVSFCNMADNVEQGDILFLLGCTSIIKPEILKRNRYNFVVHESDLPKGRGWSPVSWQVVEGKNKIPIMLIEAAEAVDSGDIYLRDYFSLDGTELLGEIKEKQGKKTVELVLDFMKTWPDITPVSQKGSPQYYRRRTMEDNRLEIDKSISENFKYLRVADNEKFPAWFEIKGQKYILKIEKADF